LNSSFKCILSNYAKLSLKKFGRSSCFAGINLGMKGCGGGGGGIGLLKKSLSFLGRASKSLV